MGRAAFLRASAAGVAGLAMGWMPSAARAATGDDIDRFVRLSEIASGVPNLPKALAAQYYGWLEEDGVLEMKPSRFAALAGVTATGGPSTVAELERSAAYKAKGGPACLRAVAAAWWSGAVPIVGGGTAVISFSDALVWRQVHEPMTCQGATGSWAKPGRAVE
ncbi:MAG TPA: sugar dehydrogenase complex small subunit [Gaiellaceae bacterium]|nr:sugar dehydrogenase complex small subunit [Gaiellaceae bacterium]